MSKVDMSITLEAPAQQVWDVIGSFNALARWHPAVAKSETVKEGGKTLRRLSLHGGGTIVEALDAEDGKARRYSYTIESGPLPVTGYRSELSVTEDGPRRCAVRWSSNFDPKGAPEGDAVAAIRGVYQAGFDALKKQFGG